MTCIKWFS